MVFNNAQLNGDLFNNIISVNIILYINNTALILE